MIILNDNQIVTEEEMMKYRNDNNIVGDWTSEQWEDFANKFAGKFVFFDKENPKSLIYDNIEKLPGEYGSLYISFDKKKVYNLWQDYPYNMTKEEVEIFNNEQPYWRKYFEDRF